MLAVVLLAIFLALRLAGPDITVDRLEGWGEDAGWAVALLFVPAAVVLNSAFVPFPLLVGAAGLLFGIATGTALGIVVAGVAAPFQMLVARWWLGSDAGDALGPRIASVNALLTRRGFLAVFYTRLIPGLPYVPLNYAAGATDLRVRDMAAGTALAKAPRTFAYAALGGSFSDLGRPEAKIAVALLVALAIVGAVVGRAQIERERRVLSESHRG